MLIDHVEESFAEASRALRDIERFVFAYQGYLRFARKDLNNTKSHQSDANSRHFVLEWHAFVTSANTLSPYYYDDLDELIYRRNYSTIGRSQFNITCGIEPDSLTADTCYGLVWGIRVYLWNLCSSLHERVKKFDPNAENRPDIRCFAGLNIPSFDCRYLRSKLAIEERTTMSDLSFIEKAALNTSVLTARDLARRLNDLDKVLLVTLKELNEEYEGPVVADLVIPRSGCASQRTKEWLGFMRRVGVIDPQGKVAGFRLSEFGRELVLLVSEHCEPA